MSGADTWASLQAGRAHPAFWTANLLLSNFAGPEMREAFLHPQLTLPGQLLPHIQQDSFNSFWSRKQKNTTAMPGLLLMPQRLRKYVELSTQMLLFDAIRGLNVEILDEKDQFQALAW